MRNKSYLIVGGSLNFFIALIHLIAIFIGAPAYEVLDAPELAFYAEMGSSLPSWITFFVMLFFILFGLYAFCAAGAKIKLPMQRAMLKGITYLFLLRGLAVFWFIYLQMSNAPGSSLIIFINWFFDNKFPVGLFGLQMKTHPFFGIFKIK